MITYKRLYALALIPLIAGSLPGCASIEKCGFGGQRDAAEAVARSTPGVKRVVDTIANDP